MDERPTTPPTVYDHLAAILDQLAALSWQKLGLQADMVTGKIAPNLDEAKVAIDLSAHIVSIIESQLEPSDVRQVQTLIRDLRMNYVQKRSDSSA
jgi:CheY-specific phosphatase CheX